MAGSCRKSGILGVRGSIGRLDTVELHNIPPNLPSLGFSGLIPMNLLTTVSKAAVLGGGGGD